MDTQVLGIKIPRAGQEALRDQGEGGQCAQQGRRVHGATLRTAPGGCSKSPGMGEGMGKSCRAVSVWRATPTGLPAAQLSMAPACSLLGAGSALPLQCGLGHGRRVGRDTYREDVGAPLGLLADGCGGGGGGDGLDAELPLADAGGGGD